VPTAVPVDLFAAGDVSSPRPLAAAVRRGIGFAVFGAARCQYSTDRSLMPNLAAADATSWRSAHATAARFTSASYRRARCGHGPRRLPGSFSLLPMNCSFPVRSKVPDQGWKL
jgi:hypothetical protein